MTQHSLAPVGSEHRAGVTGTRSPRATGTTRYPQQHIRDLITPSVTLPGPVCHGTAMTATPRHPRPSCRPVGGHRETAWWIPSLLWSLMAGKEPACSQSQQQNHPALCPAGSSPRSCCAPARIPREALSPHEQPSPSAHDCLPLAWAAPAKRCQQQSCHWKINIGCFET